MKNFIFKSTEADLQKYFQQLFTIQRNVLYTTHQVDLILKLVRQQSTDRKLQEQSDDYHAIRDEDDSLDSFSGISSVSPQDKDDLD